MMCGLPLSAGMLSPIGWTIILLVMITIVFNLFIIAYTSIWYLILYQKRNKEHMKH